VSYFFLPLTDNEGDLKTYLLARRHLVYEKSREDSDEISGRRLTSIALDVAKALSYLAELKYVHRSVSISIFEHSITNFYNTDDIVQ
jgi:hypothetical protein